MGARSYASRVNLRHAMKYARMLLGRTTVAVFGFNEDGEYTWGTGILVDFRGSPLIVTCAHVLDPIANVVYVTAGRHTLQTGQIYQRKLSNPSLDSAFMILRDPRPFLHDKAFIPSSNVLLSPVDVGDVVYVHGFPSGNPTLQVGGQIDVSAATAHFRSFTYLTVEGVSMKNDRLKRRQPRVDWNYGANIDAKRFQVLPADLTKKQRGGISGGPVVVANGASPSRLAGHVTDASDYSLFYNPMSEVFAWLDKNV